VQTTFICPQTGAALDFELPGDDFLLPQLWSRTLHIDCPVCERVHLTDYKNAYRTGVMSEFHCIPVDVKEARIQ
jgi:hypothetical protein